MLYNLSVYSVLAHTNIVHVQLDKSIESMTVMVLLNCFLC